jgi:precorrin-6Y C5,15-methyltransferase (decarboxylating)
MTPWLAIVGISEEGIAGLAAAARRLIEDAEVLIGGARHFAMIPECQGAPAPERIVWPSPLAPFLDQLRAMRGRRVTVLATGDPMHFGIGATLLRYVALDEMTIVPAVSAFALAAARLGWPRERVTTLSVHGRPFARLAAHVAPGARLLILAHDAGTPAMLCEHLVAQGFGESRIVALAHMGGARETRTEARAAEWGASVPDLHTLGVECVAGPGARWHGRTGLADDAFEHDGKLTKRDLRAAALARLMPHPGARLIDVGAGCGSVAIEWMRAADHATAIALEPDAARRAIIARNATALGVPDLAIVDGSAPEALPALPAADAVFVGGGLSAATLAASMAKLNPGGRLVAHAVTLESEALLLAAHTEQGGELVRHAVTQAEPLGGFTAWRPAMPVTQYHWRKP